MWMMGQAKHGTLSAAQSEAFTSLAFGTLPITEFAVLYKVTFGAKNSYASTPKAEIDAVARIVGSSVTVNQTGVNVHSGLSGTTDTGSHPATAVSVEATGFNGNLRRLSGKAFENVENALIRFRFFVFDRCQ
jgi:hypothetical protein